MEESSPALRSRGRSHCLQKEVTDQDVLVTLSQLSGIPTQKLTQTDAKKYLNLEAELHKRVIGQDQTRFEYQSGYSPQSIRYP